MSAPLSKDRAARKEELWRIIFLADTKAGRVFDVILLVLIAASVTVVMLESVQPLMEKYGRFFFITEWIFTGLFTLEYAARIWVVRNKRKYLLSFYGIVDLLAILPAYLSLVLTGAHFLMVTRVLRLLRMFRILKMPRHIREANLLLNALRASRAKVAVFFSSVAVLIVIEATIMYLVEGGVEGSGFTSIPQSLYWAIVTFTTVGYGDIAPVTVAGKFVAALVMLTGYAIIAVPTGIVSSEIYQARKAFPDLSPEDCETCGATGHTTGARYCHTCGARIGGAKKNPGAAPEDPSGNTPDA